MSDSLDLVRSSLNLVLTLAPPVLGQYRAGWVAGNDLNLLVLLLEVTTGASDRSPCSGRGDEVSELPLSLFPQFRTGCGVMRLRVRIVVELTRADGVGRFRGDSFRHHHVVVGMIWRDSRGRDNYLGAECLQQTNFFLRHFVGHREDALVATQCGSDRQADARIAARALHDCSTRLEPPLFLCALDDRQSDSIFDGSARIEELRLRVNGGADASRHLIEPDQWRPTDRFEDVLVRLSISFVLHLAGSFAFRRRGTAGSGRVALDDRIAGERRRIRVPEEHRQKNRHWHRLTSSFRRFELQIAGAFHRGGIERAKPGGFRDTSRVRNDRTIAIDVDAQCDIALDFLRVKGRRIAERQLLVEPYWRNIRLSSNRLKGQAGSFSFLAPPDNSQQEERKTAGRESCRHSQTFPSFCFASSTRRASISRA